MSRRAALAAALAGVLSLAAASDDPADRLKDPAQEARARHLFQSFRCVVCQNESIDDSEADIARDLREIVRRQIAEGRSDAQIKAFMTDRYGEFILLKPRFTAGNAVLWLSPFLIVLGGGAFFAWRALKPAPLEDELSAEEETRVQALAGKDAFEHGSAPDRPVSGVGMT